jgi:hypothetical protein
MTAILTEDQPPMGRGQQAVLEAATQDTAIACEGGRQSA